jgi:tRNA A-37 threonylcarbamoyl transferase component Bud32
MEYLGKKVIDYRDPDSLELKLLLTNEQKYIIARGLLDSLAGLHANKVIHGDIGLHNIAFQTKKQTATLFSIPQRLFG